MGWEGTIDNRAVIEGRVRLPPHSLFLSLSYALSIFSSANIFLLPFYFTVCLSLLNFSFLDFTSLFSPLSLSLLWFHFLFLYSQIYFSFLFSSQLAFLSFLGYIFLFSILIYCSLFLSFSLTHTLIYTLFFSSHLHSRLSFSYVFILHHKPYPISLSLCHLHMQYLKYDINFFGSSKLLEANMKTHFEKHSFWKDADSTKQI